MGVTYIPGVGYVDDGNPYTSWEQEQINPPNGEYVSQADPNYPEPPSQVAADQGDHWIPPGASFDPSNPSGAINVQNPNADPNGRFVQDGLTGGYIDRPGYGITIREGSSITPARYAAELAAAIAAGVPEGWAADYLQRNNGDAHRLIEAYNSERFNSRGDEPGVSTGGGGGGGGGGSYTGPLTPPSTAAGWMPEFVPPVFTPPPAFSYPEFVAPTREQAQAEPGYDFSMQQGQKALQNAAGSKGLLRTGGTLKELIGFGQRLGEQNYGNVFGRARDIYGTNRANAADTFAANYGVARDVFDRTYTGAQDAYAPKRAEAEANHQQAFAEWLAKLGVAKDIYAGGNE